jgi:hypothetical protein
LGAALGGVVAHILPRVFDYHFEAGRLKSAQRDRILKEILDDLARIATSCEEYWSREASPQPCQDAVLESRIVADLHSVNSLVQQLFIDFPNHKKKTMDEWRCLHDIATGGDFLNPERDLDPRLLTAILIFEKDVRRGAAHRRSLLPRSMI